MTQRSSYFHTSRGKADAPNCLKWKEPKSRETCRRPAAASLRVPTQRMADCPYSDANLKVKHPDSSSANLSASARPLLAPKTVFWAASPLRDGRALQPARKSREYATSREIRN